MVYTSQIYSAPTVEAAEQALVAFEAKWAERFPVIGRIWRDRCEEAVRKVLYLAIQCVSERWTRPIGNWPAALNHFAIVFDGRVRP